MMRFPSMNLPSEPLRLGPQSIANAGGVETSLGGRFRNLPVSVKRVWLEARPESVTSVVCHACCDADCCGGLAENVREAHNSGNSANSGADLIGSSPCCVKLFSFFYASGFVARSSVPLAGKDAL